MCLGRLLLIDVKSQNFDYCFIIDPEFCFYLYHSGIEFGADIVSRSGVKL
jgi:hypothetical protein